MNDTDSANSIRITAKVFGGLRDEFQGGTQVRTLPIASTLSDLMQDLGDHFPDLYQKLETGLAAGYLNILINGKHSRFLQGRDTQLQDGDVVAFLPPVGGG